MRGDLGREATPEAAPALRRGWIGRSRLELLAATPARSGAGRRPALLFLHGAFAGAWVWGEHVLPYAARRGHAAFALSFRGHGASGQEAGEARFDEIGLTDYAEDVRAALAAIGSERPGAPVVLVGHSLGGLVAQECIGLREVAAVALCAPVPWEGMLATNWRLALSDPALWSEMLATATLGTGFATPAGLRRLLLSDGVPETIARGYFLRMRAEPRRALAEAQFPRVWRSAGGLGLPALALAPADDRLIPPDAVFRTALFHGADYRRIDRLAHALMLDARWRAAADALLDWVERAV